MDLYQSFAKHLSYQDDLREDKNPRMGLHTLRRQYGSGEN